MELNGWQRLGIIASVLWLLGGASLAAVWSVGLPAFWVDFGLDVGIMAVVPIVCGWMLAWIIPRLTRWVRRGFALRERVPPKG